MNPQYSKQLMDLLSDLVFVFGSNRRGIHGAGAAKDALNFGAKYGQGRGLQGRSYALPTKETPYQTLSLDEIKKEVDLFNKAAEKNPLLKFLVTPVGTGRAGYKGSDIAPLFEKTSKLPNVALPREFRDPLGVEINALTQDLFDLLK